MNQFDEDWQQDSERNSGAGRGDESRSERRSFNPNFTPDNHVRKPRRRVGETRVNINDQQQGGYNRGGQQGGYNRGGYNRGGYNQGGQQGGYNRGGYNQGGQQGDYNRGGYNQGGQQGGYNRGGYNQGGQQGDYNRGGYNQGGQQGGYNRGGYNRGGQGGFNGGGNRRFNNGGQGGNNRGGFAGRGGRPQNRQQADFGHRQIEYKSVMIDPTESIRLNKYLANAGTCSRREADELIQAGAVSVNGVVITELGTKILRGDKVMIGDQPVNPDKLVYILLNKPKGCVTSTDDPNAKMTVMDLVKNACKERIYPVGRLDRNTTGVLLLTNDGDLASKLTHPMYNKKKIYQVNLNRPLEQTDFDTILGGIDLEDGPIKPDELNFIDEEDHSKIGIEIHSGRNRIVRRVFERMGYKVMKLDRVFFAGLIKKGLKRGAWRFLTEREVTMLRSGQFE